MDVSASDSAPERALGSAFELVTLLPGLTTLNKRSGEIDGNLPVRGARYCSPVFEGSAAGFQISLLQPMTVARGRNGRIVCDLTPPALRLATDEIGHALEKGVKEGLIGKGGTWHRLLKGDAMPVRGNRLLIWTGHLVRPRGDLWLLVGGAFNRRSRVRVVDHIASDPNHFVPLIVEVDTRELTKQPIWLEGELGCVTPVVPTVRFQQERLQVGAPELRQLGSFFSEEYFDTKAQHPTAKYMRAHRDHRVKATPTCEARLLSAGPNIHTLHTFDRFVTTDGFARTADGPGTLEFAVVRNFAPARWTWQGQTHSAFEVKKQRHLPALRALWKATFGDGSPSGLGFLEAYLVGELWDQPYVQFQPWVLGVTPLGWSMLVDGVHRVPAYDGMRGIIATDWFFALSMVYRMYGPATVEIPYRAPMLRALPVPRWALDLSMTEAVV